MLWTIAVVLLIAWVIGMAGVYTIGALVHLFLVLAVVAVIFQLIRGRRVA
jgi:Family of unknown function (DUF5670)